MASAAAEWSESSSSGMSAEARSEDRGLDMAGTTGMGRYCMFMLHAGRGSLNELLHRRERSGVGRRLCRGTGCATPATTTGAADDDVRSRSPIEAARAATGAGGGAAERKSGG